ncbi:MAG: PAS domain S-box protein [Bacteroidota bacterium]
MQNFKVLIFEPNADHKELIYRSFLRSSDEYSLTFCMTRQEMINHLKPPQSFSILLYSLEREDESGSKILNNHLVHNSIPVIFLCGPVDEFRGVELIKNGAIDYIPKTHRNIYNLPFFVSRALREWENIQFRRSAERRLFESESKFRMVTENISDVIWEMDIGMNEFSFISSSVKAFLGYSEDEFIAMKPQQVITKETLGQLRRVRKEIVAALKKGLKPKEIRFDREIAFIHRSGDIRWGEVRGFLVTDSSNRIVAVSGIVRNITAQKQMQQQLAIREAYFETLIREAPVAIVILDNKDRVTQVNNHFVELFQYEEEECINRPINELIIPEDLLEEANSITQMALAGEFISIESVRQTRYGQRIEVSIVGKPVIVNGKKLGVLGMYQDISQRRKLEIATHVARIKQQFLANMSHEIRSPMTGIRGMIDLLQKTPLTARQAFYLDIVKKSSDGLLSVVNDILDFSKIEAGKMVIRNKPFNLKKSAITLFYLFQAVAEQKGVKFVLDYDDTLPENINGDENRISQIVTNLLSNAVKFTSEGEIRLIYKKPETSGDDYNLLISVSDTGIGIEKEDADKLFTSFTQLDNSDTRVYEGTGLGLSISSRLAELMNGELTLESVSGRGSTFCLHLRSEAAEITESANQSDQIENAMETSEKLGYKILLAEDKRANQIVISLMFRQMGCIVDLANNGEEALELFIPGKYNFIFMDIQMPKMDGLTAVKNLRENYTAEQLPVIVGLSARSMEGDAEFHIREGMDDYLAKPASYDELKKCLLKWGVKP